MRSLCLSVAVLALVGLSLFAQQPAPPAQPDPQLLTQWRNFVLENWEKAIAQIGSLEAECHHSIKDKTFGTTEYYVGTARFLKSTTAQPSRASLELKKVIPGNKLDDKNFKKYVCSGNFVYEYVPQQQLVRVHELPGTDKGQMADDNVFSFIFGMKANQALGRYDISFVPPNPNDKNYHYLLIKPKNDRDRSDFVEARLSLVQNTFMIRQLWFLQANGNEVVWDLPKVTVGAKLSPDMFTDRDMPATWKKEFVRHNTGNQPPLAPKVRSGSQ